MNAGTPSKSPRRAVQLLIGALVLFSLVGLLVVLGLKLKESQQTKLSIGQEIKDFSVTTFDGKDFTLSDQPGKIILLNFWSSWCASCDEEGAALEQVWQEVKDNGDILFLGVNYVDTDKDSLAFLQRYNITYPNGADLGSRIANYFKVDGVPETYLINGDGTLAAYQIGPFNSPDEVRAFLELGSQ